MFSLENAQVPRPTAGVCSPILPFDHPHAERPLKDHYANRENTRSSPRKPVNIYEDNEPRPGMHKKNKSSVSLKSLIGNDKAKTPKPSTQESENGVPLKRPKSSTGLSALLSRSKTPKEPRSGSKSPIKDQENRTPPQTADLAPPPIWAQFSTQKQQEPRMITSTPLNDRINVEQEGAQHMPQDYSPSKQRNYHDYRPTLVRKTDKKPRPQSGTLGPAETNDCAGAKKSRIQEEVASEQSASLATGRHQDTYGQNNRSSPAKGKAQQNAKEELNGASVDDSSTLAKVKRGSRVMAAVAALNGGPKDTDDTPIHEMPVQIFDVKAIDREFETLLVSQIHRPLCALELNSVVGNKKYTAQCS